MFRWSSYKQGIRLLLGSLIDLGLNNCYFLSANYKTGLQI